MRIFLFATFIYFLVVVVYEIFKYDETLKIEDKRHFFMLGHIRYLSGIVAATLLLLIPIPYFEWLLLVIWIKNQYNTRDMGKKSKWGSNTWFRVCWVVLGLLAHWSNKYFVLVVFKVVSSYTLIKNVVLILGSYFNKRWYLCFFSIHW